MKKSFVILIVFFLLECASIVGSDNFFTYNSYALASETENEPAPGFNACMENAMGKRMIRHCYLEAEKYWGKKLDILYPKVIKYCSKTKNPQQCKDKVKKMELAWLEYTKDLSELLFNGVENEQREEYIDVDNYENNGKFLMDATIQQFHWLSQLIHE